MRLNEVENLFEYKALEIGIDHTVWITDTGKIYSLNDTSWDQGIDFDSPDKEEYVENAINSYSLDSVTQPAITHGTWLAYNAERIAPNEVDTILSDPYQWAFDHGWLRIRAGYTFDINSTREAARRLFKYWYPTVKKYLREEGELFVMVDEVINDERNSIAFKLPRDTQKMLDWAGRTNESLSAMYGNNGKGKKVSKSSSSNYTPASNDIFVDTSEENEDMIAVTLKGRTALISKERAARLAEKLLGLSKD